MKIDLPRVDNISDSSENNFLSIFILRKRFFDRGSRDNSTESAIIKNILTCTTTKKTTFYCNF